MLFANELYSIKLSWNFIKEEFFLPQAGRRGGQSKQIKVFQVYLA
jgi:hypothetical protein